MTKQTDTERHAAPEERTVHTELRPLAANLARSKPVAPAPRAKVMPPEIGGDDDDMWNDMPV